MTAKQQAALDKMREGFQLRRRPGRSAVLVQGSQILPVHKSTFFSLLRAGLVVPVVSGSKVGDAVVFELGA